MKLCFAAVLRTADNADNFFDGAAHQKRAARFAGGNEKGIMGSDSVRVKILGDEYSLRADCGGDSETVRQVAHYVDSKTKEFWREVPSKEVWRDVPSKANTKVAVMSALNIASELFEVKAKYEAERKQVELLTDKIKSLNERIQKSL